MSGPNDEAPRLRNNGSHEIGHTSIQFPRVSVGVIESGTSINVVYEVRTVDPLYMEIRASGKYCFVRGRGRGRLSGVVRVLLK
jgi:hypothetical protein